MEQSKQVLQLWKEARTRFTHILDNLEEDQLKYTLGNSPNTLGYLIRHVADVELLFAKNVFGRSELKVKAQTMIDGKDNGEWTNKSNLLSYALKAHQALQAALLDISDDEWTEHISTKEFGEKTRLEALGRITSHTSYHAGQMKLIQKYGH